MKNWWRSRRHLLNQLAETRGALREAREENAAYGRDLMEAEVSAKRAQADHDLQVELLDNALLEKEAELRAVESELARVKAERRAA